MHAGFKLFHRVVLALGLFACFGWVGQAHAVAPTVSTFEWVGDCSDCSAIGNPSSSTMHGTLVLQGYTLGDLIELGHLVSFTYSGSDLVNPYVVEPVSSFVYGITGTIASTNGPGHLELVWGDGLHFETQVTGAWSTCAPGGVNAQGLPFYYGGNSCNFSMTVNTDYGTAGTFSTAAVPEPGVWALLCAGLGVLALARRRRGH